MFIQYSAPKDLYINQIKNSLSGKAQYKKAYVIIKNEELTINC